MPSDVAPYLDPTPHPRPRRTFRQAFAKSCADRARTQAVRGIRLARAVRQARIAQAVRFLDPTAHHALARHGLDTPRDAGPRRNVSLGGRVVAPRLNVQGVWALVAALDNGIPLTAAALLAIAVGGCTTVEDHRDAEPVATYVVEQDVATAPGQHLVTAIAACEDGDQVLGGGCSFGEVTAPGDPPLRAVVAAPDAGGFTCTGQNTGVGVELKTVRATAVCLAGGAS